MAPPPPRYWASSGLRSEVITIARVMPAVLQLAQRGLDHRQGAQVPAFALHIGDGQQLLGIAQRSQPAGQTGRRNDADIIHAVPIASNASSTFWRIRSLSNSGEDARAAASLARRAARRAGSFASASARASYSSSEGVISSGKAQGLKLARRHPAGKGRAQHGDQRHARPQRIAGRHVAVIGAGIQHQVGQLLAGQMAVGIGAGREDQPRRIEAGGRCRAAKIVAESVIGIQQPQHTAGHGLKQPQPGGEDSRA